MFRDTYIGIHESSYAIFFVEKPTLRKMECSETFTKVNYAQIKLEFYAKKREGLNIMFMLIS